MMSTITTYLTQSDIIDSIYDPMMMQQKMLYAMGNSTEAFTVTDPTNPFVMLLEATLMASSNAAIKIKSAIRMKYPYLAETSEELYHHISDDEMANMFAVPAEAYVSFYINTVDLRRYGYRPAGALYVSTTIPIGTSIDVMSTTLTLLNDIEIRLYDNGAVMVEQQSNSNDFAINDLGILTSIIQNDSESISWIVFATRIKQVKITTLTPTVDSSSGLSKVQTITDNFCYSTVSYKANTATSYTSIAVAYNDEYIDPKTPTAYISVYDKDISIKIPDVYTVDGGVSGNVLIEIYETKGSLYLPINKYLFSDFTVTLGKTGTSPSASTLSNITRLCAGTTPITGGSNGLSTAELKKSIIFNSTGDNDLPITDYDMEAMGSKDGYYIYKSDDVITDRVYIAGKNLPVISGSNEVYSKQDVFFNTVELVLSEIGNYSNINVNANNFVIRSGSLFKSVNGIVTMLTNEEVLSLQNMVPVDKIAYLQENKIYFSPYYYIVSLDNGYTTANIFNLDTPAVKSFRILNKNSMITSKANTSKYSIVKTSTGYALYVKLSTNTEFDNLDKSFIKMQLSIPSKSSGVNVYFDAVYMASNDIYRFDISSDMYIDVDGYINITNGSSTLNNKYIDISSDVLIYLYTTDQNVVDDTKFLVDEIYRPNGSTSHTVFAKESMGIEFGKEISNLWNRVYNTYSERKYKTYTYDAVMVYDSDVYEVFDNNSTYHMVDGELVRNLLYHAGDVVTDSNGETVYMYHAGDTVYDGTGNPIIDSYGGVMRYIDIMMLEYEFLVANTQPYTNYLSMCLDVIDSYLFTDMKKYNAKLLDNTMLYYKSFKSCIPVKASVSGLTYTIPYMVKPIITLYVDSDTTVTATQVVSYSDTIGVIIDGYFDSNIIKIGEIEDSIKQALGSTIIGVKVSGIDSNDSKIISMVKTGNRLALAKKLELNTSNEYIVRYDIIVNISPL